MPLTFIDLFAGIGGLRYAFESIGGECVMTSEWNPYSMQTYRANHPESPNHVTVGDISSVSVDAVPSHDVLLAGFPCQPFSRAGLRRGFDDPTQGTLFFDVKRILEAKRPAAFLLENVKNLASHDAGRTFEVIRKALTEDLGYQLHHKVISGVPWVPQRRERIVMVGFREPNDFDLASLPVPERPWPTLADVLHRTDGSEPFLAHDGDRYFDHASRTVPARYTLGDGTWSSLQAHAAKHAAAGNGFGYGMVTPSDTARTISARYHKDGSEILVAQDGSNPRRLTPRECARLMGFPDSLVIPVSNTQAYRQFGNSVVVPLFSAVAAHMAPYLPPAA